MIVEFKSFPVNYYKELSGSKPNTIRQIDYEDERFMVLKSGKANQIKIINSVDKSFFIRDITDYSEWEGWAIISWAQYTPKKKWLSYEDVSYAKGKTKMLNVNNKITDDFLGRIAWEPTWRQYAFVTEGKIILAEGCTYELFNKIKELRQEHERCLQREQ